MSEKNENSLPAILLKHREDLIDRWVEGVINSWALRSKDVVREETLRSQAFELFDEMLSLFDQSLPPSWKPDPNSAIVQVISEITKVRASQGFTPGETSRFLFSYRQVVNELLVKELTGDVDAFRLSLLLVDNIVDSLSVVSFEAYAEAHEALVSQQSQAILELTSPAVRLWDDILLMSLVGVIDTSRARQITESLLNSIAETESLITILDITGVPVLDTAVAGHLMRTVTAAKMLGTTVILTGISPEGAQTLARMGVDLGNIRTRGSLRSGVAEGLAMLGKTVVTKSGQS